MIAAGGERVRHTAVEAALADLERALCRDRCHAVVCAAPGAGSELLQSALGPRLAASLRVLTLPAVADADALCVALLALQGEPPGLDAEASLIGVAKRLASQGSALALLVPDARALPLATLRRLGRLAVLSRPGLRLVLCIATDAASARDSVAELMGPLGIGAVKVVLESHERAQSAAIPARILPAAPAAAVPAPAPAAIRFEQVLRRTAALRRLAAGRPGRRAAAALCLALAVAALYRLDEPAIEAEAAPLVVAAAPLAPAPPAAELDPEPDPEQAPEPDPTPAPPARPPATPRAPVVAARAAAAASLPVAYTPAPAELPAAPVVGSLPASAPPLPAQVAEAPEPPRIRVSVNADPWARIQVDGRDVGVTPMADLPLAPGTHRFRVRFPDGRVIERSVHVDALRDHLHFP